MKTFLLFLSILIIGSATAQTDTTSGGDYFLTFVKKIYLNPTVYLRCESFKETTNIGFVALPDLSSSQNNASSGFEKGLQKLLRLLMSTDGGVRFYFNPDTPTAPFTFWHTDNLGCKFKQPEKDSILYYLNHNFSDSNLDLNNNQRFESTIDETLDYIQRILVANPSECGEQPQNETTTINTKPLSINLHNTSGSKYDIDYKQYDELESSYAVAEDQFTGQQWYAPSKMFVTGGGTEPVTMSINLHDPQFKKENLKIEVLKTHSVLQFTYTNDSVRFNLPDNLVPSDPLEITVKYKSQVDSVNYIVGFFMVHVVAEKKPKVVLLGANGYGVTPTDVSNVQTYLNKVYKPTGVNFEVGTISHVFMNDYPTMIEDEGSGLLSNYPSDLHDYIGDIKDFDNYDTETYYLVLGLNNMNSEMKGYMPRARNIGFIFFEEGSSTFNMETVAHELGHGAFHFRHIFSEQELGENNLGTTQNIMDYSDVSIKEALYLHQWNFIQDPAFVSWSEGDDEEAEIRVAVKSAELLPLKDGNFFHFITPNRTYISLPVAIKEVEISLMERYGNGDGNPNSDFEAPIGSLVAFRDEYGKRWFHRRGGDVYYNDDSGTDIAYKPGDYDETSYGGNPDFGSTGAIVSWVKVIDGAIRPTFFKRFLEDFTMGTMFMNPYYNLICYQDFVICGDLSQISNYPTNTTQIVGQGSIQVVRGDLNIRFVLETINLIDTNSFFTPLPPEPQTKRFSELTISDLFGQKNNYSVQEIITYLSFMDLKQQDVNALSVCSGQAAENTIIRMGEIVKGPLYITYQAPAPGSSTIHTTVVKSRLPEIRNSVSTLLANNLRDYLHRLNLEGVSLDQVYQSLENYKQVMATDPWPGPEQDAWQAFLYDLYNLDVCNYGAIDIDTRLYLIKDVLLPTDNYWECSSQRGQSTDNWITRPLLFDLIWTTPDNQKDEIYKIFFKDGGVTAAFEKFWEDMDNGFAGAWGNFGYDAKDYRVGKLVIQKLMEWPPKVDKAIYGNPDKKVLLSYPPESPLKDYLDGLGGMYNLNDLFLPMGDISSGSYSDLLILGRDKQFTEEVEVPMFKLLNSYDKPVSMEDGKFYIKYNYRLSSIYLTKQGQPKWNEVSEFFTAHEVKLEVSPFQKIEVVMTTNNSDLGLDRGNTIPMTVLEAFLLQRDIDEEEQAGDVRILTVVGSTILTVVTLGETAPLLVAVLTTANAIDVYYTTTKNDLTTTQRESSFFYSHWEEIKFFVDMTDIAINGILILKPSLIYNSIKICQNARLFNTGRLFRWMKRADKLVDGAAPTGKMVDAMSDIRRVLSGESPFSINYQFNDMLDISGMGGMGLRGGVVGPNAPFKALDLTNDIFRSGKVFTNKIGTEFKMYVHAPVNNMHRPIGFTNNYASGLAETTFDVEAKVAQVAELEELAIHTKRIYEMDQLSGTQLLESIQEMNKLKEQSVKINTGLTVPKSVAAYTTAGKLLYYGTGSGNSGVVTMMAVKYDGKIRVIAATKTAYQLIAQKVKEKEEEEQEECEECTKYASQVICHKFELIRNKPTDNLNNFTKLLCGRLQYVNVSGSTDWIYEHVSEIQEKLKYDLNTDSMNVNSFSFNRNAIDADLLEAWKIMHRAKPAADGHGLNYCRDYASIVALKDILTSSTAATTLGGDDGVKTVLQKNTTAPCDMCSNNNLVYIKMDMYLKYVKYFAENYTGKTDYEKVLGPQGIKSGGPNQVNATAFILRVLYENPNYVSTISGFEEKLETVNDDGETNRAFADIIENSSKVIECKSWALNGMSFQSFVADINPSGSAQQFITYIGNQQKVNSMSDLEYWFDKMKLGGSTDPTPIKQKFQQMLVQNGALTIKGNLAFNAIFNNPNLKTSLFQNRTESVARTYFVTILSDTENDFYDFINVK